MGIGDFLLRRAGGDGPESNGHVAVRLEAVDSENGNPVEMLENMGIKTQQLGHGRDFSEAVEYVHEENMQATARELSSLVSPEAHAPNGQSHYKDALYCVENSGTTMSVLEEDLCGLDKPTEEVPGRLLFTPMTPTEESSYPDGDWESMENEKEVKNKWCFFSVNESGCKEVDSDFCRASELPGKVFEPCRGVASGTSPSISESTRDAFTDPRRGIINGSRRRIAKLVSRTFTDIHPGREGVTAAAHVDAECRETLNGTACGIRQKGSWYRY
eukprot:CAMPEP_0184752952 /NCGR_PEP_ID=MMETSP0315-20130426/43849_1 /TAXON_ID=101924 /ORGANISM="Rhodosorus marinus, Strain UTEX LB 2760" /LENGTH=271 /DNA_ID=CAMNT_0027232309 /DNA_START=496 /DNA_END=1311 /DNA_ORIENTATION=-